MAKYTTQIRSICENYASTDPGVDLSSYSQVIQAAIPKVFDFSFPIFNEQYRHVLQTKILKHFYTWEIGEETVGLWKLRLDTKLNEIMPYYNKLYLAAELVVDPFLDADYTTTNKGKKVNEGQKRGSLNQQGSTSSRISGTEDSIETDDSTTTSQSMVNTSNGGSKDTTEDYDASQTSLANTSTNSRAQHNDTESKRHKFADTPQTSFNDVGLDFVHMTNVSDDQNSLSHMENDNDSGTSDSDVKTTSTTSRKEADNSTQVITSSGSDKKQGTTTARSDSFSESSGSSSSTTTSSDSENFTTTDDFITHVKGKFPGRTYAEVMQTYRDALFNTDLLVIAELKELFMLVL